MLNNFSFYTFLSVRRSNVLKTIYDFIHWTYVENKYDINVNKISTDFDNLVCSCY